MIPKEESQKLKESLLLPVALVALMFVIHLIKNYSDLNFIYWGIFPRKPHGLIGILTAPLVHGNWRHLFSNAIPFLSLMTMCLYFYRVVALRGIAMIWILTGASVWLLGNFFDDEMKNVSHIGASGVVYGLVAFIFWNGIFVKSSRSIVLALAVLVLYAGMFEGILPNQPGISWESHLFGGLAGIFTAYFYKDDLLEDVEKEKKESHTWADEFDEQGKNLRFFLPRDIFEKTKTQRRQEAEEQRRLEMEQRRLEAERRRREAEGDDYY